MLDVPILAFSVLLSQSHLLLVRSRNLREHISPVSLNLKSSYRTEVVFMSSSINR